MGAWKDEKESRTMRKLTRHKSNKKILSWRVEKRGRIFQHLVTQQIGPLSSAQYDAESLAAEACGKAICSRKIDENFVRLEVAMRAKEFLCRYLQ